MFPSSSPSKTVYRGVLRSKIYIWDPKGCFCVTPGFEPATRRFRVRRPTLWTSLPLPERGFRPSPGTMSRAGRPPGAPAPSPFVLWCPAPGVSGRAPLCSGEVRAPSGAGRRGAVVMPARDLYVASRARFSCPGSSRSLPLVLASCGELIALRMSAWEALRAENDSFFCPVGGDHCRPSSTSFSTGLSSFWLILGSPATSYRRDVLRVTSRC